MATSIQWGDRLCRHRNLARYCVQCNPYSALARSTDPATSHAAAKSLTPDHIRASQVLVLDWLTKWGPCTDELLVTIATDVMSPSGVRSRRAELVALGKVYDTGETRVLKSGRRGTVWAAR